MRLVGRRAFCSRAWPLSTCSTVPSPFGVDRLSLDQAADLHRGIVLRGRAREERRDRRDHAADLPAEDADGDHRAEGEAGEEQAVLGEGGAAAATVRRSLGRVPVVFRARIMVRSPVPERVGMLGGVGAPIERTPLIASLPDRRPRVPASREKSSGRRHQVGEDLRGVRIRPQRGPRIPLVGQGRRQHDHEVELVPLVVAALAEPTEAGGCDGTRA